MNIPPLVSFQEYAQGVLYTHLFRFLFSLCHFCFRWAWIHVVQSRNQKHVFLVSSDRASDFAFLAILIQAAFVDVNTFSLFTTPFLCLFLFKPNFLHTFVLFILLLQATVVSEFMTISASGERCFFVVCTISFIFAIIILFSLASFPSLVPTGRNHANFV